MKTKKMNNNGQETADRVTIRYSGEKKEKPCSFCERKFSAWDSMSGLEFILEGDGTPVCFCCVKEKVPDLYRIWREVQHWNETTTNTAWERGVESGQRTAGEMILDAIDEPVLERIKRVCRVDLGVKSYNYDDVPF